MKRVFCSWVNHEVDESDPRAWPYLFPSLLAHDAHHTNVTAATVWVWLRHLSESRNAQAETTERHVERERRAAASTEHRRVRSSERRASWHGTQGNVIALHGAVRFAISMGRKILHNERP